MRPSRLESSLPPSPPPVLPQLPYAPLSATVDDMLEWMRERQRAAKRYQETVHQQWVQKSSQIGGAYGSPSSARRSATQRSVATVGSDAADGAGAPRGASADVVAPGDDVGHGSGSVITSSDTSLIVPFENSENHAVGGATSPSSRPAGPQQQQQHDAHILAMTRFENEGLQRRIAELRGALSAAVGAIERQHVDAGGLKRRIRALEQHLRESEVAHQRAVDLLLDSSASETERVTGASTVCSDSLWWTTDPFTDEENAVIQDIVQRRTAEQEVCRSSAGDLLPRGKEEVDGNGIEVTHGDGNV